MPESANICTFFLQCLFIYDILITIHNLLGWSKLANSRSFSLSQNLLMQAYTVELEAELNVLKQENEKLKQILVDILKLKIPVLIFFFFLMICVF